MSDTNWIRDEKPDVDEVIFAEVQTNEGPEYYVGNIDEHGTLLYNDSGDDTGWTVDCIERWCPLDVTLEAIGG